MTVQHLCKRTLILRTDRNQHTRASQVARSLAYPPTSALECERTNQMHKNRGVSFRSRTSRCIDHLKRTTISITTKATMKSQTGSSFPVMREFGPLSCRGPKPIFILTFFLTFGKLWEARSRWYRRRFLQVNSYIVNTRLKALDEIYTIYTLLHRFEFKNSAKFRLKFWHFCKFVFKNSLIFNCFCNCWTIVVQNSPI